MRIVNQEGRLYPKTLMKLAGEATPDKFEIAQAGHKGVGLASKVDFELGESLFTINGLLQDIQTLYTLQIAKGLYIHDPYVVGRILHSCSPNMEVDMNTLLFTASKDILAGQFLTMDYESTEDYLVREFICSCGFNTCRGKIKGRLCRD